MWRYVIRCRPHVNLLVYVEAGDYKEDTGTLGTAPDESAKPKDDCSLVLLHHLHHPEEGYWEGDDDEEEREEGKNMGEEAGPLLTGRLVTCTNPSVSRCSSYHHLLS